jgi:EAL domain-containing protein (putative c-di-GMP-specific phosphodiesterase class I)
MIEPTYYGVLLLSWTDDTGHIITLHSHTLGVATLGEHVSTAHARRALHESEDDGFQGYGLSLRAQS